MIRPIFAVAALSFFLFSCNKPKENSIYDKEIIYNSKKTLQLEDIPQRIDYISLDIEKDDALFGYVNKVIMRHQKIYILDVIENKFLVFNEDGSFFGKVGNRGQGPTEYLFLNDCDVDENGNIYLYDAPKKELLVYDNQHEFEKAIKLPFSMNVFAVLPNGNLLFGLNKLNEGKGKGYQIVLTDKDINILKEYIPYKDYFDPNFLLDSFIQRTKDGFLYYRGIDDVVYSFSLEGNLTETINMNFGEKKVPYEFRSDLMTFLNDEEKHYQYLIYAPVKVGNYLAAVVKDQHVRTHFIYNEKDQSIYKNSEIKVGDLFYPQFNVNDSTFISILQESIHTEFESDPMLTEAQKKLLEEGGTIICKYTIKTE